jgi:hypothetical protein
MVSCPATKSFSNGFRTSERGPSPRLKRDATCDATSDRR